MLSFGEYLFFEMRTGEGLALVGEDNNTFFVLFENNLEFQQALINYDYDKISEHIFGVIELRDNQMYQTMEVDAVWARKGYGPLMYLIALKSVGSYGLTASRVQVSAGAKEIWRNFYEGVGKKFINAIPLGAKHHEEGYLNYKYVLKVPYDIGPMLMRGKVALRDKHGEKRNALMEAAAMVLRQKLGDL